MTFKPANNSDEAKDMIIRGEALGAVIIPEDLTTHLDTAKSR